MNKKISLGMALCLVLIAIALSFQLTYTYLNAKYTEALTFRDDTIASYEKLYNFDHTVKENYIGEIDDAKVMDGILKGYMSGLGDKYGIYYTAEEYEKLILEMKGQIIGIGVSARHNAELNVLEVVKVYEGSPAETAGIKAGYYITGADGVLISEDGYDALTDAIGGKEGTKVTLTVTDTDGKVSELVITRAVVEYSSVDSRVAEDIAIVTISEFNKRTYREFKSEMDALRASGIKNFIFDLRNNLGGDLDAIVDVLDYILPEGPIVRLYSKNGEEEIHSSDKVCLEANVCVLINEYTASAAELFAAAIKDYKYGTLIGTITYGKGTAQSVMQLPDGSGLRLSTEMYLPPYSDNYEGEGVSPDIPVEYEAGEDGAEDSQMSAAIEKINEMKSED